MNWLLSIFLFSEMTNLQKPKPVSIEPSKELVYQTFTNVEKVELEKLAQKVLKNQADLSDCSKCEQLLNKVESLMENITFGKNGDEV